MPLPDISTSAFSAITFNKSAFPDPDMFTNIFVASKESFTKTSPEPLIEIFSSFMEGKFPSIFILPLPLSAAFLKTGSVTNTSISSCCTLAFS
ncbi:hypothetical protein D3C72_2090180 [compost metagenome]